MYQYCLLLDLLYDLGGYFDKNAGKRRVALAKYPPKRVNPPKGGSVEHTGQTQGHIRGQTRGQKPEGPQAFLSFLSCYHSTHSLMTFTSNEDLIQNIFLLLLNHRYLLL